MNSWNETGDVSIAMQQARFRIQSPNSTPRKILVLPLGDQSDHLVTEIADQPYRNAQFVPYTASGEPWRSIITKQNLDLVVMIGHVGENFAQVIPIGETCLVQQIKISGVLIDKNHDGNLALSSALRSIRPWTQTLAVISEVDYLPGLLHALGA